MRDPCRFGFGPVQPVCSKPQPGVRRWRSRVRQRAHRFPFLDTYLPSTRVVVLVGNGTVDARRVTTDDTRHNRGVHGVLTDNHASIHTARGDRTETERKQPYRPRLWEPAAPQPPPPCRGRESAQSGHGIRWPRKQATLSSSSSTAVRRTHGLPPPAV